MRSAVAAAVKTPAEPMKTPASDHATMEAASGCVGLEPLVEVAQALLAQLSRLMPLFVLGRRPAHAGPAPIPVEFLPVANAVPTVHVAVATCITSAPPKRRPPMSLRTSLPMSLRMSPARCRLRYTWSPQRL